jgi:formylmethanofuran dehydrogenase subunit C
MKTSLIISAALVGLSAITFAANESSEVKSTSAYNPGKFYGIIVNNNANIILTQGESNAIRFEGDQNDLKDVKADVENGALVINGTNSRPVSIYISVEEISLIEINGSARLFASGSINSDILLLKVNGSGSMKLDIRALTVGMIVKGTGKIIVSGTSGESFVRIYGTAGNIYKDNLDSFKNSEERIALIEKKPKTRRATLKLHQ